MFHGGNSDPWELGVKRSILLPSPVLQGLFGDAVTLDDLYEHILKDSAIRLSWNCTLISDVLLHVFSLLLCFSPHFPDSGFLDLCSPVNDHLVFIVYSLYVWHCVSHQLATTKQLAFTEHLLQAKHWLRCFTSLNSFNKSMKYILLLPFYRWRNWDITKLPRPRLHIYHIGEKKYSNHS